MNVVDVEMVFVRFEGWFFIVGMFNRFGLKVVRLVVM